MTTKVRLVLDQAEIRRLLSDPEATELVADAGREFAAAARGYAPRRTGAGAASIGADAQAGVARVSWDSDHHYMAFHQFGTHKLPADPFMDRALDQYDTRE